MKLQPFGNGNLGFWILGALLTLSTTFMFFDRTSFQQRLEATELWQVEHNKEVAWKEQQLWNHFSKMDVKLNRLLLDAGYTPKEIKELEETATTYERKW